MLHRNVGNHEGRFFSPICACREGMTENHMLEFLSQNTKEPFFMFIPTIGAHPSYRGHGDPETAPNPSGPCFKEGLHFRVGAQALCKLPGK